MSQFNELKDFIARQKPKEFSFWSENQYGYNSADPCKLRLTFPIMLMSENPKVICLKDDKNSICLDRIKTVGYIENAIILGTIITVVCTGATYTIVAS